MRESMPQTLTPPQQLQPNPRLPLLQLLALAAAVRGGVVLEVDYTSWFIPSGMAANTICMWPIPTAAASIYYSRELPAPLGPLMDRKSSSMASREWIGNF